MAAQKTDTASTGTCNAGDVIAGRYQIEKRLGRGGMGSVYLARDLIRAESLALKYFPHDAIDEVGLEQVRAEFLSLAEVRHPNLMATYEFGYDPASNGYFLTLEYIKGNDLLTAVDGIALDNIEDRRRMLSIFCQLLRGLGFIHDMGLVYGDVKPHNMLVDTSDPDRPLLKIIDFGIVSRERGRRGDRIWGTPSYVAPEMIRGSAFDRRVDLYAVGVMMYRVVAGVFPFSGANNLEIMKGHLDQPAVPPSTHNPGIPAGFDEVVLRMLEKQPDLRHQSAFEVIDDINQRFGCDFPLETFETAKSYLTVGELAARHEESDRLTQILSACCSRPADDPETVEFDDTEESPAALPNTHLDNIIPTGHTVLLQGTKGSGINRLTHRLRSQAQSDQVCVIECACGGDQAIEEIDRMLDRVQALSARAGQTAGMDAVVTLQRQLRQGRDSMTEELWEQCKTSLALVTLTLIELSRTYPILFLFRDAHLSGPLQLELIRNFVQASSTRSHRENQALLVTTTDPVASIDNETCRILFDAASFQSHVTCLTLEPIDERPMAQMVSNAFKGSNFSSDLVSTITRQSDGHVRNASRILRFFLRQDLIRRTTHGWFLSEDYRDRRDIGPARQDVDDILRSLPPRPYRLAIAFAVIDDAAHEDLVCALADIPESEFASLVSLLKRQKIVREKALSASHHGYVLANSTVRRRMRNMLDAGEWADLNEFAGNLLETKRDLGNSVTIERLAHYFLQARNPDKGQVYGLERARDLERRMELNGALSVYLQVHELIGAAASDTAALVCNGIARLRLQIGDYLGVTRVARQLDAAARAHGKPRPFGILLESARARCRLGEFPSAFQTLLQAETLLDENTSADNRIDYLLSVAELHYMRDDHVESLRYCEAAEAELTPHVNAELAASVCLLLSQNYAAMSVVVDAARYCQRALRFLDMIKGGSSLAASFLTRGAYYNHRCQYGKALKQLDLGLLLLRQSGSFSGAAECMLAIGKIHRRLGHLRESKKFLDAALSVFRKIGMRPNQVQTECELAHVSRLMGNRGGAHRLLDSAIQSATELDKPSLLCEALFGLACHEYDHGQFVEGDAHLNRIARISRRTALSAHTLRVALVRSDVAVLCGNLKQALERAKNAVVDARELRDPVLIAAALRRQAQLQLRLGNVSDARRHLANLLDLAKRQRLPLEEGWGRFLDAVALVAEQKPELAHRSFDSARIAMSEYGGPRDLLELHLHRGWFFLTQGQLEDAYVDIEEGLYLSRMQDLPYSTSRYLIARALLEATLPDGQSAQVEEYLRNATEQANRGPFPEPLWQAQSHLATLLRANSRDAEAEAASIVADHQLAVLIANTPAANRDAHQSACMFAQFEFPGKHAQHA